MTGCIQGRILGFECIALEECRRDSHDLSGMVMAQNVGPRERKDAETRWILFVEHPQVEVDCPSRATG